MDQFKNNIRIISDTTWLNKFKSHRRNNTNFLNEGPEPIPIRVIVIPTLIDVPLTKKESRSTRLPDSNRIISQTSLDL